MVRPTKLTSEQVLSINRSLCEKSYYHFLREAWPIIDPSVDFSPNWHIQAVEAGVVKVLREVVKDKNGLSRLQKVYGFIEQKTTRRSK